MNQNVFRAGVVIGTVALLALVAPIIWAAASAGVGLIALGAIGIVGFGLILYSFCLTLFLYHFKCFGMLFSIKT